jgi:caffeoyl-CoA O-methyltransferase
MQSRSEGKTVDYVTRTFAVEPDYIARMRKEGEARRPGMQVSAYEGSVLAWIVAISGAKNILEIGTFMGYSTLWMASALPENGHITSLEFSADYAHQARENIHATPCAKKIEIIHTEALPWLQAKTKTGFDLVFIDADKRNYFNYLNAVLPLMNPRGWIVGDNTLLFGALSGDNPDGAKNDAKLAMTQFNEALADPTRFDGTLLTTPEGLTVARLK